MSRRRRAFAGERILIGVAAGVVLAAASIALVGWIAAPSVFWLVAATVWLLLTWPTIWRMNDESTARWATREDPTIGVTHLILILASVASLGGVALLLVGAHGGNRVIAGFLGLGSVAASWAMVHTIYTLGYAALYYRGEDGGIEFNQKARPAYADFAYFGFTIGMTYQVSDTTIEDPIIRRVTLRHALLSYLLGAVVLAIAINTVATLAG